MVIGIWMWNHQLFNIDYSFQFYFTLNTGMNLLVAFFRLIRWLNLVFIALTQLLFYYFILPFVYRDKYYEAAHTFSQPHFYLLVTASVFIAAAGYIINDYFDLNIDIVNKPSKLIIEKFIKR